MPRECDPLSKKAPGRSPGSLPAVLLCLSLAAAGALNAQLPMPDDPPSAPGEESPGPETPAPETPFPVLDLVEIHPFSLHTAYRHHWLASQPEVSSGLLVVLRVDRRLVVPRNVPEPVLYGGGTTVEALNQGNVSGYVIGIVPGEPALTAAPFFFGRPQLPARVDAAILAEELALAGQAGIAPFSAGQIARATREAVEADDLAALLRTIAGDLVIEYSPDETRLAEIWRLPTTGAPSP